jgi:uncharacterized protein YqgV (UPF0045/DUF77 family)
MMMMNLGEGQIDYALQVEKRAKQALSEDLSKAKNLLIRIYNKHPETRSMIEKSTGTWFVWGQDRDVASHTGA